MTSRKKPARCAHCALVIALDAWIGAYADAGKVPFAVYNDQVPRFLADMVGWLPAEAAPIALDGLAVGIVKNFPELVAAIKTIEAQLKPMVH